MGGLKKTIIIALPCLLGYALILSSCIPTTPHNPILAVETEELDLNVCGMNNVECIGLEEKCIDCEPTLEDIITEACLAKELGDYCVQDLLAIATVETGQDNMKVGDHGNSYGLYQIHRGYHPDISIEQARDNIWATEWTLNRLIAYGYPTYRSYAIQCHNSCTANNGYIDKVNKLIYNNE